VDVSIDAANHHGCTDAMVSERTLATVGISSADAQAAWPRIQAEMVAYFATLPAASIGAGLQLLPGVPELLAALQRDGGAVVGLVTGNLQPIAWAKMEGLGIAHLFSQPRVGGFGSDAVDRDDLVRIARARAEEFGAASGVTLTKHCHVGDTPKDVTAARAGGALALGVCTGVFSAAELAAANPEAIILCDLADTAAVLRHLLA
jgi:phosphoglycolate phosphatase-like HAD superfamily hydrolase